MAKPWPKQKSGVLRASMRATPRASRSMVTVSSRPRTLTRPLVLGSGRRKS
jgi:hypothetical protein